jgi:hypothetical protein
VNASQFLIREPYRSASKEDTVKGFFKTLTMSQFTRMLLPFLGVLVGGIGLMWYAQGWPGRGLLLALGEALFVAGVVGLGIEMWSASALIEHTAEQLSLRLVGYGLPKAAQAVIHELVHKTKLVYRDYRKAYRIAECPGRQGFVTVRVRLSYNVVNNGQGPEYYLPTFAEERIYNPVVTSIECGKYAEAPVNGQEDLRSGAVVFTPRNGSVRLVRSEAVAAMETLAEDQVCRVRWEYVLEMPREYSDVTAFRGMTVNPVLELDEKPETLEFEAAHGEECIHMEHGSTWTYNRAFIAGQHVRVWWRPTRQCASSSESSHT